LVASQGNAATYVKEKQATMLERRPSTDVARTALEVPDPATTPMDLAADAVKT
jgi:hypothetical protein